MTFQKRANSWLVSCLGPETAINKGERNHRFLEEALELVQSCGCTANEAHQLVDYVYSRAVGETQQEVGGVMTTLAMLCAAQGVDMLICGENELSNAWENIERIRARATLKPKIS